MNNEEIMQQWQRYKERCEELTNRVIKGDVSVSEELGGFAIHWDRFDNQKAKILEGIAEKVIPAQFEYRVLEIIGGNAELVLEQYNGDIS